MLFDILRCPGQPPQESRSQLKMLVVLRLRHPGLHDLFTLELERLSLKPWVYILCLPKEVN